jgi:hypothetical protein
LAAEKITHQTTEENVTKKATNSNKTPRIME